MCLLEWTTAQGNWKLGETTGCAISVPAKPLPTAPRPGTCRGLIERASVVTRGERKALSISGWSATDGAVARAPDASLVELRGSSRNSYIADTLSTPRPEINRTLGVGEEVDFGFSRLLPGEFPSGTYSLSIIQRNDGQGIACAPIFKVVVP